MRPGGDLAVAFVHRVPVAFDLATGRPRWRVEREGQDFAVAAFDVRGERVAVGSRDGTVLVLRADDGTIAGELAPSPTSRDVQGLAFSPDGRHLAVARGECELIDTATYGVVARIESPARIETVSFASDGDRLCTGSPAGYRVWTVPDGRPADGLAVAAQPRPGVPIDVAGDLVLLGRELRAPQHRVGGAGPFAILSLRLGDAPAAAATGDAALPCLGGALAPNGASAVLARDDGSLLLVALDGTSTVDARAMPAHERTANRVRFARDGSCFVSGYAAGDFASPRDESALQVRDPNGTELLRLEFPSGVRWFDVTADGEWLVVKTGDGELSRWPIHPLALVRQLELRALTPAERRRHLLDGVAIGR